MPRRSGRNLLLSDAGDANGQVETTRFASKSIKSETVVSPPPQERGRRRSEKTKPTPKGLKSTTELANQDDSKDFLQKNPETNERSPGKKPRARKTPPTTEKAGRVHVKVEGKEEVETITGAKPKKKRKVADDETDNDPLKEEEGKTEKSKRRRKTKEEKEAEAMPLAARTTGLKVYIGAHVSSAKGPSREFCRMCLGGVSRNALRDWDELGTFTFIGQLILRHRVTNRSPKRRFEFGNAFALFLKSQRKWDNPALNPEHSDLFKSCCQKQKYDAGSHVLPHGSYLVNLAQKERDKAKQAYDCFLDDLKRCDTLGIKLYNFHPGSTLGEPRIEAIARIASAVNLAHRSTSSVKTVLENMAGSGNVIGSTFEDLRDIINLIDDKSRVGVCLDTCHAFAAGYDLRTPPSFSETMSKFSQTVGMQYLSALHLNDSKAPFASHRDLHQNIGLGFLGLRAFWNVMNEPAFEGLPMVLETPIDREGKDNKAIWANEIKLLEGLIGMDTSSSVFLAKEKELADMGAAERKKLQDAFDRKVEKDKKATAKRSNKGGKGKKNETESDSGLTTPESDA
ncbi:MAG: hypothetical protein M1837_002435 [Sclerophora amabilis]|nr:MAG: hypothetical protein M1837_002435 [Sclerophora amabilis]